MTREIREIREMRDFANENANMKSEGSACSVYTMAAVASCLLFCIGIVVYALIGA